MSAASKVHPVSAETAAKAEPMVLIVVPDEPFRFVLNPNTQVWQCWDLWLAMLLLFVAVVTPFEVAFLATVLWRSAASRQPPAAATSLHCPAYTHDLRTPQPQRHNPSRAALLCVVLPLPQVVANVRCVARCCPLPTAAVTCFGSIASSMVASFSTCFGSFSSHTWCVNFAARACATSSTKKIMNRQHWGLRVRGWALLYIAASAN